MNPLQEPTVTGPVTGTVLNAETDVTESQIAQNGESVPAIVETAADYRQSAPKSAAVDAPVTDPVAFEPAPVTMPGAVTETPATVTNQAAPSPAGIADSNAAFQEQAKLRDEAHVPADQRPGWCE